MEGLPSGVPEIGLDSRWRGAAFCTVARLGNHYCDRYEKLLVNGLEGDLLPRITDHGLRKFAAIVAE
jgi:hypothetical protein